MFKNEIRYFAEGNTARGFHDFYESNLVDLNSIIYLKNGPISLKSSIIKNFYETFSSKGMKVELLESTLDTNSFVGAIIPAIKLAIIDKNAPKKAELQKVATNEITIDLLTFYNQEKLEIHKEEFKNLNTETEFLLSEAYNVFSTALSIHDEWEKNYIANLDTEKTNELTQTIIDLFINGKSVNKKSSVKHRFIGTSTTNGAIDHVQSITKDIPQRYFIKGRPGTGKSTLLKKIGIHAEQCGYDVEIYHCGFDPNSLDMIALRELGIVIFDSTSPHEYFPERANDKIVDVYEYAVTPGTDEKFKVEIDDIINRYSQKIKLAYSFLQQAKVTNDEIELLYKEAFLPEKMIEIEKVLNIYK